MPAKFILTSQNNEQTFFIELFLLTSFSVILHSQSSVTLNIKQRKQGDLVSNLIIQVCKVN